MSVIYIILIVVAVLNVAVAAWNVWRACVLVKQAEINLARAQALVDKQWSDM